jgi:hypothetical protein
VPEPFDSLHRLMSGLALDFSSILMVDCVDASWDYSDKLTAIAVVDWGGVALVVALYIRFTLLLPKVGPARAGMKGWPLWQVRSSSPLSASQSLDPSQCLHAANSEPFKRDAQTLLEDLPCGEPLYG